MSVPVDVSAAPIADLARAMSEGALTSEALTGHCLARIEAEDRTLNAFVEVYADEARAAARALDAERKAGTVRGPLHGIPVAVKDLADIAGRVTTFGSRVYSSTPAGTTAPFVDRLITAGMVVLGKTQQVEFALGSWGTNHVRGTPWNPRDRAVQRTPGGSSSGSAVAVAAGLTVAAIGSDTGGSVRIPCSLCGIVGLKTTIGAVPTDRVAPLAPSFDTIGPMTRCVDDARLVFEALAARACPALETVGSLVAGIVDPAQLAPADPEVARAVAGVAGRLAGQGLRTVPFRLPRALPDYQQRNGTIMAFEGYAAVGRLVENRTLPMDPFVRERMLAGRAIPHEAYEQAQADRAVAKEEFATALAGIDLLLMPTTPLAAVPLSEVDEAQAPMSRLTRVANYLDLCAVSVPVGKTKAGMPIGLQIVARGGGERTALGLAAFVEAMVRA